MRRSKKFGALAIALVSLVAACGDDSDTGSDATSAGTTGASGPTAATTTGVPADANLEGILKVGVSLDLTGGLALDPIKSVTIGDEPWILNIYGALMRANAKGGYDPWFAKSVEIVNPTTIKATLNSGIVFSDGTPYDGQAVKTGILRNLNTPQANARAGHNALFAALGDIVVDSPTQVTFQLKQAVAGEFMGVLSGREAAVPSPKAIADGTDLNTKPVGAGPFVLRDYKPTQILSLRKSPTGFEKDKWLLAGFDFIHSVSAVTNANGLAAGDVDFAVLDIPTSARFDNNPTYGLNQSYTDFSYLVLNFCSTKPPFDNVKARQAVQYAIDRANINNLFLQGKGRAAYAFWTEDHANFNSQVKSFGTQDLAKAKQLAAESGLSGQTVDLVYPVPTYQALGEVMQQQMAQIGVKLNIAFSRDIVNEFIVPKKPGMMIVPGSRPGLDKVFKIFQPGTQQNLCDANRTDIMNLANQVGQYDPADPKAAELYKQIDLVNAQNAYTIFLANQPRIFGFNKNKIGGTPVDVPTKSTVPYQNFERIYLKK